MESNVKRFETELNYDEVRRSLAEALAVLQDALAVQETPATAKNPAAKQPTAKILELDIKRLEAERQQARHEAVGFGYAAASVFAGLLISGAAAMLSVRRT